MPQLLNVLNSQGLDAEGPESAMASRVVALEAMLAAAHSNIDALHRALDTSRLIGAAVGIIMATQRVTQDEAYEVLRVESQTRNRKLRDLASDVALTGAIGPWPAT